MSGKKIYTIVFLICLINMASACGPQSCDCTKQEIPLPEAKTSGIDGKRMVLISSGEFIMGTDKTDTENLHRKIGTVQPLYLDQHPERKVFLRAFYIDQYEVTNEEYKTFLDASGFMETPMNWEGDSYPENLGNHPVTHIIWSEAWSYCMWARKQLPTEGQWEKAARGFEGSLYPWGNDYEKGKGNIGIEGWRKTAPVGGFPEDVSAFQVYDMAGNVMEWTLDWYLPYPGNTRGDPRFGKRMKVLRGNGFQKAGHYFLEAYRYSFARTEADPDSFYENVGFRCASSFIEETGS